MENFEVKRIKGKIEFDAIVFSKDNSRGGIIVSMEDRLVGYEHGEAFEYYSKSELQPKIKTDSVVVLSDITEEQASELVELERRSKGRRKGKAQYGFYFLTAKESLISLLKENGVWVGSETDDILIVKN